jgi:carboxymethylenebutenolidase
MSTGAIPAAEMNRILAHHAEAECAFDFDETMRTMTDDCYQRHVNLGLVAHGKVMVRRYYEDLFGAFPKLRGVQAGVAYGDRHLVMWGRLTATMTAGWLGIEATGRTLDVPLAAVIEFRDGLVVGEALHYDAFEFCAQLGLHLEQTLATAGSAYPTS